MTEALTKRKRPAWLWPVATLLVWVLAAGVSTLLYNRADPTFFMAEVQRHLDPLSVQRVITPLLILTGALTVLAYVATFWKERLRRPRFGLVILTLAWSLILGSHWCGRHAGNFNSVMEWVVAVLLLLGPPAVLLTAESMVSRTLMEQGMRLNRDGDPLAAVRVLRWALLFRSKDRSLVRTIAHALYRGREWRDAEIWLRRASAAFPHDVDTALPLATALIRQGQWSEAIPFLRRHLDIHLRDQEAWEMLAEAHLEVGQTAEAIWALEQQGRRDPEHLGRIAQLAFRVGDLDRVLALADRIRAQEPAPHRQFRKLIERVLEADPERMEALERMANLAAEIGDQEEVLRWRERILHHDPGREELRREVVEQLHTVDQPLRLEQHLRVLCERDDAKVDDLVALIESFIQRRSWEDVETWVGRGKSLFPDAWEFLLAEAQVALHRQRHEQAFQLCHMARARSRSKDHMEKIDSVLARIQRAQSQSEVREIRAAIDQADDPVELRWELIEHLTKTDAHEQITTELDEILREHPEQSERVMKMLDDLLKRSPDNFALLTYTRDLLLREGAHDAAFDTSARMAAKSLDPDKVMREACDQILQAAPRHALSLSWMLELAHREGDWGQVIELHEKLRHHDPQRAGEPEMRQRLFDALCALGELERGDEVGRALIDERHRAVENLKSLARLHQAHGDLKRAKRCQEEALEIDNQDREARDAVSELDREIRRERIEEIRPLIAAGEGTPELLHELGDLLCSFEEWQPAIQHLQQAKRTAKDPRLANLCGAKMAHALARRKMLDLAHETIVGVSIGSDDPQEAEALKAIFFNVAEIFREAGQDERARAVFKQLFLEDAGYRNVAEKLDDLGS